MIIPSIDLMQGKAVQLEQGERKILEVGEVWELAKTFSLYGELAVIDLDAAKGIGNNRALIVELCQQFPCRVGGGIRTVELAREYLKAGAEKIIIGTKAEPEFFRQLPREHILVALDVREGEVCTHGWTQKTGRKVEERLVELEDFCDGFLVTVVDREGLMRGTDLEFYKTLREKTKRRITAAGGIHTIEEVCALAELDIDSQLGMAVYQGKLNLTEAYLRLLKCDSLIPTIVQDEQGQVLMLAYSSPESLRQAFSQRRGIYYSRRRQHIWVKGDTSGNTQELLRVQYDCDRDTLLFTVHQKGAACHKGSYSCFESRRFSLETLLETLRDRIEKSPPGSYTARLAQDPTRLAQKIMEEAREVTNAENRRELIAEIADLLYMLSVRMAKENVAPQHILKELRGRKR